MPPSARMIQPVLYYWSWTNSKAGFCFWGGAVLALLSGCWYGNDNDAKMLLCCTVSVWQRTAAPASRPLSVTHQKGKKTKKTELILFILSYVIQCKTDGINTLYLCDLRFRNHLLPDALQQLRIYTLIPHPQYVLLQVMETYTACRSQKKCTMKGRNMHRTHNAQLIPVLTEHGDSSGCLLC